MPDWNVAWNAGRNKRYQKLGAGAFDLIPDDGDMDTTHVFGVVGPDTAFDKRMATLPSNLVIVIEAADSKTHWMQPGDYEVDKLLAATGRLGDTVKGILKDRVHVLFADGQVWALSPDTPIDALKPFLTIAGAKTADRDRQLAPYRVD